jgi:hypothetical protein
MSFGMRHFAKESFPSPVAKSPRTDRLPPLQDIRSTIVQLPDSYGQLRSNHCRGSESLDRGATSNFVSKLRLSSDSVWKWRALSFADVEWTCPLISTRLEPGDLE